MPPCPNGLRSRLHVFSVVVAVASATMVTAVATGRDDLPESLWSRPGEDWPVFLGPSGNGRSRLDDMPVPWPEAGPRVVWHAEMGEGYCPPTAALGRLLVFDRVGSRMRLRCLHAETGRSLWETGYESGYVDTFGYDGGPRACPVVAGDRVLTYGPEGRLRCQRLADGELAWEVDTAAEYHVVQNFFGVGTAPLVVRVEAGSQAVDLVVVQVGGSPPGSSPPSPEQLDRVRGLDSGLVAFDLATGREAWRVSDELASYSSPVAATIGGRPRLLAWMRGSLLVVDPAGGRLLGRFPYRGKELFSVNAANPVLLGDQALLSETYGPGSVLVDLAGETPREVWRDRRGLRATESMRAHWATPIVHRGFAYGFSGRNSGDTELVCMDWENGAIRWHAGGLGRGGMVLVGEQLVVVGEFGDLVLVDATPDAYRERSRVRLADATTGRPLLAPPCWAAPIVAHGYGYLRGAGRVVCIDLGRP